MAWGIMMTVLALFGMMGMAIFEATSGDAPATKPNAKHKPAVAHDGEMNKAA